MAYLIKWGNLADFFPTRYFYFFSFFLFLFFLFLLSLFLFEFNTKIGKLQLDHIIYHLLNLIFNLRQNFFFYLSNLGFVLCTGLILPFTCMLFYLLLHDENGLCRATPWVILFEFIFFCNLFFSFCLYLSLSFWLRLT